MAEECEWNDRLRSIERDFWERKDTRHFSRDDAIDYVLDAAEPIYQELWALCSIEERLVLRHLAEEGLVNPRSFDLLRRLRRRRLVRIDPRIRLASESFRRFVLEAEDPATIRSWERPGIAESSARVRGPLLALGFVTAGIFLVTLGDELDATMSLATAAAGTVAAVSTLVANARRVAAPPV